MLAARANKHPARILPASCETITPPRQGRQAECGVGGVRRCQVSPRAPARPPDPPEQRQHRARIKLSSPQPLPPRGVAAHELSTLPRRHRENVGDAKLQAEVSSERRRIAGQGKREISKKTRRPAASFCTIFMHENPRSDPPGIEHGSTWWEASGLATKPPRLLEKLYLNRGRHPSPPKEQSYVLAKSLPASPKMRSRSSYLLNTRVLERYASFMKRRQRPMVTSHAGRTLPEDLARKPSKATSAQYAYSPRADASGGAGESESDPGKTPLRPQRQQSKPRRT
ncbi:hypothetical protein PR048_021063 [Dryococelus australis]|uniref:Uncharacterized protein n=1 Tax=Dryococelus australis TaxID=614101 RepID=A0ABQ9GX61_9NEOP|nr:hypothetical protein PR048_021063 [Dryococelus australis]